MAYLGTLIVSSIALLFLTSLAQPLFDASNNANALQQYTGQTHHIRSGVAKTDELRLLDTVLVASVDGRFHAVNRTTGRVLWHMDTSSSTSMNLGGLVRTHHAGLRAGGAGDINVEESDEPSETYIIEPQTGNIYVHAADSKRDEPLQRLPMSMSQLVDMSPFRFNDDDRTFVGRKRTSLISLDLRSGEVLEVLDPEQCSWSEANPSRWRHALSKDEELLDELDPPERTVVHVGRTEYHVSVFANGRVVQNLTYSAYGPNNMDKEFQVQWHQTPDNWYHQGVPDGHLLMFKTDERDPLKSVVEFKQPIVAVFDAVTLPNRENPILLLQPTPPLQDLYPSIRKEITDLAASGEVTYVGRLGDSLYALGQKDYPHVLFPPWSVVKTDTGENAFPYIERDMDEYGDTMETCVSLKCLQGPHYTKSGNPEGLSPLIASASASSSPPPSTVKEISHNQESVLGIPLPAPSVAATSSSPPVTGATPRKSTIPMIGMEDSRPSVSLWTLGPELKNPVWTGLVGLIIMAWMLAKRIQVHWSGRNPLNIVAQRDTGFEPSVIPPLKVENRSSVSPEPLQRLTSIVPTPPADVKLLPPVPSTQVHSQETTVVEPSPPPPDDEQRLVEDAADAEDGAETEKETGDSGNGKKGRKPVRRKRGKGGGSRKVMIMDPHAQGEAHAVVFTHSPARASPVAPVVRHSSSLEVSDTVLGYGSHGTMVFQGTFQGRAVAVKRLLQDFVTLASREVTLLQESDDHPNVIRYYFKETRDNFLYIALELCPASLADIVERPHLHSDISTTFDPKRALSQVTLGLRHLHSLKIVHRDIKPHNILVSKPISAGTSQGQYRMLISDFGLCRKLESDQTSFLPTMHSGGGAAAGTVGWRAPEILKGDIRLDELTLDMSSGGTPSSSVGGTDPNDYVNGKNNAYPRHRLTKAVDVFALGCLYYYTLAGGEHAYGERFEREVNIVKDVKKLDRLAPLGEDGTDAEGLITKMLSNDPKLRPDTTACLLHPYFWNPGRRLAFLQDASDRFEIMGRDPPEPQLVALETDAREVVGPDWHKRLDKVFDDNLGKFRKYDGKSVQDLMRALRNKKHHYQDLPDNVKRSLGVLPEGFLAYFTRRFPRLFLHVYHVIFDDPLLRQDAMFRTYFQFAE